jgi:hypothetical protein
MALCEVCRHLISIGVSGEIPDEIPEARFTTVLHAVVIQRTAFC